MASESSIGRVGFFENAEVTTSGRPVLRRNEVECFLLSSVDLDSKDDPPRFTALRTGNLTLTTHRLIWIPSQSNAAVPSSLPLAVVTHIFSHKKSIKSMFHSLESGSKRTPVRLSSPSSSGEKVTSMAFGPSSGNAGEVGHGRKMIRARPRLPAQDLVRLRKAYKATTER